METRRRMIKLSFILLLALNLITSATSRRWPAAVLPGLGNIFGKKEEEPAPRQSGQPPPYQTHQRSYDPAFDPNHARPPPYGSYRAPPIPDRPLPPPPPPLPDTGDGKQQEKVKPEEASNTTADESDVAQHGDSLPNQPPLWATPFGGLPPPPPPGWGVAGPGQAWGPPPNEDWRPESSQFYPDEERAAMADDGFQNLNQQLDDSLMREHEFFNEIQNLTAALSAMEQREDLHMRQLDVLTERVMEVEAEAASERNAALEYQANCTELGRSVAAMQDELEEWRTRCLDLNERHTRDEEKLKEMKDIVKERNEEVEQLATSIEIQRVSYARDKYLSERKAHKSRGFFGWLFGAGKDYSDDYDEEELQELAKSTLLRALETERDSVYELEAALSILQQNNSAISEVVESRDMLINELNQRVAVFEEDKFVLKAALKQLQIEMKEEAPKTQKLVQDLKQSKDEIERLNVEIHALIATHQDEISLLQRMLVEKESSINETESNLTVIGSYVDKLEERLASFAIARRELDIREQKCEELEENAIVAERERDEMKTKIAASTKEHEELKALLEELVSERSKLQQQNTALTKERNGLLDGESSLRDTITTLEDEAANLVDIVNEWKSKVRKLELELSEDRAELKRQEDLRLQEEQRRQEEQITQEELRRQEELAKQAQLERLAELKRQEELWKQELLVRQAELERQEELRMNEDEMRQEALNRREEELRKQEEELRRQQEDAQRQKEVPGISIDTGDGDSDFEDALSELPPVPQGAADDGDDSDFEDAESKLPPGTAGDVDESDFEDAISEIPSVPPGTAGDVGDSDFEDATSEMPPVPSGTAGNVGDSDFEDALSVPPPLPPGKTEVLQAGNENSALITTMTAPDRSATKSDTLPSVPGLATAQRLQPSSPKMPPSRNVPFRGIRKTFSRYTGIHGLFTPPSRRMVPPPRNPIESKS